MKYQFALNINDDQQSLSPKDGLPFGDLGELIKQLDFAVNSKKNGKCTLYDIQNHGYTPHFTTDSKATYDKFIEVHNNIYEKEIIELNRDEAAYANALKKVLKGNKYLEALDNDNKPIQRIYPSQIEKSVDFFNVIKVISGIVSEIGSPKLDRTSHVYIDGFEYKIFITPEQDEQLRQFYKNENAFLDLKINQKRSVNSNRIISARLISYTIKTDKTLHQSLGELSQDVLSIIDKIIAANNN